MKHFFKSILCVSVFTFALAGCAQKSGTETVVPEVDKSADITMEYEAGPMTQADIQIVYEGVTIDYSLSDADIVEALGGYPEDYEDNNQGNISNGNGYRRWQLCYPNYAEPEISIVFLSKQEFDENGMEYHGEGYSAFVRLENIETARGICVGDSKEEVLSAYGEPLFSQAYTANSDYTEFGYGWDDYTIKFVTDETGETIRYIMIDYRMEQADNDQFLERMEN